MPIDASIPLQVRPPQQVNPLADIAQIYQLKQAQQLLPLRMQQAQQEIQESKLKLDAATTEAQERLGIKQAIQEAGGDIDKALPKILQVAPTHGLAFATAARQAQQEELKATGEKLKNAITSTELGARVLQGVPEAADPNLAYQQSLKVMQALGLDHGQMSPTYDPQQVQQYIQSGLSTKDQLAKKQTELKDKLEAMGRTKVTAEGLMQQNPATGAFDIKVGEPEKTGAPTVHQAEDGSFHVISPNGTSVPVTENGQPLTGRPPTEGKENDFEQFYKAWREEKKAPDSASARLMAKKAWTAAGREEGTTAGTWQLQEDSKGNTIEYNTKTGQTRTAPDVRKAGTFAKDAAATEKAVGPARDALQYANDYISNGDFTGPGDEALQEKFFELAKPSTGFKMTRDQMKMLQDSRGWTQGATAIARHAITGTWFSDSQRKQIVKTMGDIAAAKMKAKGIDTGDASSSVGGGQGKITVTAPDGSTHPFDTQAQADAFKKLAHIP